MDTISLYDSTGIRLPDTGPIALSLKDVMLFEALGRAYPDDDRFRWSTSRPLAELAANPCHGDDDPLLMLYFEGGRPVAGLEAVRDRILLGGQPYEWMWFGNQLTLPECRGRGLMVSLFDTAKAIADKRGISIGGVGTTPAGRASYLRNGFQFLGYAPRQCLVLRADRLVSGYIAHKPVARIGALLSNGLLLSHRAAVAASLSRGSGYYLTLAQEFDTDISPLFEGDPRYPRFSRERQKMKWRWDRAVSRTEIGSREYRLGLLRTCKDDELAGFFMLRLAEVEAPGGLPVDDLRLVTVVDWAARYEDQAARRALVYHAMGAARDLGGEILEFTTSDTGLQSILRRRGFPTIGGYRMYYRGAEGTPFARKEPHQFKDWWWNGCDPEDAFTW